MNITWQILDENGLRHHGTMPFGPEQHWLGVENNLFMAADKLNATWLGIKLNYPDGSGHHAEYKKTGRRWVRVFSDNTLPNWFPWFFFMYIIVILLFLVLFVR